MIDLSKPKSGMMAVFAMLASAFAFAGPARQLRQATRASGPTKAGPGWSNRQVRRMAAKRRNVARNRRAHRG